MPVHAWCDHVVHVHLASRDLELAQTCARLLQERFADREADACPDAGYVELRAAVDKPVTAGEVAHVLADAQVRAYSIFDRPEWSVAEV